MQTAGWDPIRGQWIMVGQELRQPARPKYREPYPIRAAAVWAGIGVTSVWFLFFALLAWSVRTYAWSTFAAGAVAGLAAAVLNRYGDRGVALGIAVTSAVGVGIAGMLVGVRYLAGDWILW
jgi:hypothetical protein